MNESSKDTDELHELIVRSKRPASSQQILDFSKKQKGVGGSFRFGVSGVNRPTIKSALHQV